MSMIIAHRGYSGKYPENTMLAFEKALEYGAEGLEIDIQLTKDGEVVICHDEQIDRTSNGKGYIKDLTLAELKQYTFNNQMDGLEEEDAEKIKIPTLIELLDWMMDTQLLLNIEFKTSYFDYQGIVAKTIDLVKERNLEDRIFFSSFNHHTLKEVKALDERLECGFLTVANLLNPGEYCQQYKVEHYHPLYTSLLLTPEVIEDCKANGININTYTVNDAEVIKQLLNLEVGGIITNEVELAVQLANS